LAENPGFGFLAKMFYAEVSALCSCPRKVSGAKRLGASFCPNKVNKASGWEVKLND
jgi:hypothetical protein